MTRLGEQTPVERRGVYWMKREDRFVFAGMRGGKVRTCLALASAPPEPSCLVTAGSRHSPQVLIVARVARAMGLPCRVHVPAGADTPETRGAREAGAVVVGHSPGYNTVIVARARQDAEAHPGARLVPFGMECEEAVEQTAGQVSSAAAVLARRWVVPVGSGMTISGVLRGLARHPFDRRPAEVVGVVVGADPSRRLARWRPFFADPVPVRFEMAAVPYHVRVEYSLDDIPLDPVYESKCVPFLSPGDLFWVVGHRDPVPEVTL
jgi:1-aminocyclopropane-1-carboxylate deaminase/D-cysteine desulfhydrase-like pyridoxal-dependent ACC family enzyme